jgi:formate hydrogenlyase transcriptional activator
MQWLQRYTWPGNIRELQNFIERSVILSSDRQLRPPLSELRSKVEHLAAAGETLDQAEREHILKVLEQTKWMIGGPRGAALRLGLKRTTLLSKMQRLGISRSTA